MPLAIAAAAYATALGLGAVEVADIIRAFAIERARFAAIAGHDPIYVHFTTAADALAIVADGHLNPSRTITNTVYAVVAGGLNQPGVQYACRAEGNRREVAIIFRAAELPETANPEEVIWHTETGLDLIEPMIVSVEEAEELLDGTLADALDPWND